jgi:hypothetical protein
MHIASISAAAVLAVTGAVAGVASGSGGHSGATRTVTVTKTRTVYVLSTTNTPPVAARISRRLAAFGTGITSPRGPYLRRPAKITFSTGPYNLAAYVDHLRWVDWGQPVAYASGSVHTSDSPQAGYVVQQGGVVVDQLRSCNGRSYYTYSELFAPAGFPYNSQETDVATSGQALTPCS